MSPEILDPVSDSSLFLSINSFLLLSLLLPILVIFHNRLPNVKLHNLLFSCRILYTGKVFETKPRIKLSYFSDWSWGWYYLTSSFSLFLTLSIFMMFCLMINTRLIIKLAINDWDLNQTARNLTTRKFIIHIRTSCNRCKLSTFSRFHRFLSKFGKLANSLLVNLSPHH